MKPARPDAISLYDEPWQACGKKVCLTPAEASRVQENKVEIAGWMRGANDLLDYYEGQPVPSRTPVQN